MRLTNLSRSIFDPHGSVPAPVPGVPSYSYSAPDAGTVVYPPAGGPGSVAGTDPDAGTLIVGVAGTIDPCAGTLIIR